MDERDPRHEALEDDLDDEQLDEFLAEFDAADRHAAGVLREALADTRGAAVPAAALAEAGERLRPGIETGRYPFDWIARGAGLKEDLPEDDADLLLTCAAATISPREETGLEVDNEATLMSLEHADWLGAIVTVVRGGPGARASPSDLAEGIRTCPEVNMADSVDPEDEPIVEAAFVLVSLPWHALGLIDEHERLTPLGAWTLPRALARAWGNDFDASAPD